MRSSQKIRFMQRLSRLEPRTRLGSFGPNLLSSLSTKVDVIELSDSAALRNKILCESEMHSSIKASLCICRCDTYEPQRRDTLTHCNLHLTELLSHLNMTCVLDIPGANSNTSVASVVCDSLTLTT